MYELNAAFFRLHVSRRYPHSYAFKKRPVKLVFYAEFTNINLVIEKKQLKSWSRAKKEALIEGRYDDLPNLAKKKFR